MTYTQPNIEEFSLPLPITQVAKATAQQFATQQSISQKQEQVYLNTLAVFAVNDYLQMMGIATDLTAGDSWNPVMRLCVDVADLEVTGKGRLECRPLKKDQQICSIPPEVSAERIGYILVQIDESVGEATLLGFTQTVANEVHIYQLQPIEDVLTHLSQIQQPEPVKPSVTLSQWFENLFAAGWQSLDSLFGTESGNLAWGFRQSSELTQASVKGVKLIDLGMELESQPLTLLVGLIQEADDKVGIRIQLHPAAGETYLPANLQLILRAQSGKIIQEVRSRTQDNYIQLKRFKVAYGKSFSIQVVLDGVSVTEEFSV